MTKIRCLKWFDILILSVILFGQATYLAILGYQSLLEQINTVTDALNFTEQDNYNALIIQAILLILALVYLWFRKFDFTSWNIKPSAKGLLKGIGLFFLVALSMDIFFMLGKPLIEILPFPSPISMVLEQFHPVSVIYACLNGFYEEIFFLGICMSLPERNMKWGVIWAFFVRFIFHIYQGMFSAIGISLIFGGIFWLIYKKSADEDLFPFFVAHTIADIIGLSIFYYVL